MNKCVLLIASFTAASVSASQADVYSFIGNNNDPWASTTSWSPDWFGSVAEPFSDTLNVANGNTVVYDSTAGDFQAGTGTLNLSGPGSGWNETGTGWIKFGVGSGNTGTLTVTNGASFNAGAAGEVYIGYNDFGGTGAIGGGLLDSTSSMTLASGGLIETGASTFDSSGTITMTGDFRIRDTAVFTLSGGSITTPTLSFDLGNLGSSPINSGLLDISGGALTITSNFTFGGLDGIYLTPGSTAYVNFTTGSTGSILFADQADAEKDIFGGVIRLNGVTYNSTDYTNAFIVTHPTAAETLISVVPEPGISGLVGMAGLAFLVRHGVRRAARLDLERA